MRGFDAAFGVGHHADHIAARVEDACNVPREAVEVLEDGTDFMPSKGDGLTIVKACRAGSG